MRATNFGSCSPMRETCHDTTLRIRHKFNGFNGFEPIRVMYSDSQQWKPGAFQMESKLAAGQAQFRSLPELPQLKSVVRFRLIRKKEVSRP